jgi:hypothetical protein
MFEAFECFVCRKVMALIGGDPNRCPECGAVHGSLIKKSHIHNERPAGRRVAIARKEKPAARARRKSA